MWPNLILLDFLHVALSRGAYGFDKTFDRVGPLFWLVFCAGFYFLLLRYFVVIARDMYRPLAIRPSGSDWNNRILLTVHNGFFIASAGLEVVFLALCYGVYLAQRL